MNSLRNKILKIRDDLGTDKRKAIQIVRKKIEPLEFDYLTGKIDLKNFFNKISPIQEEIRRIVEITPLLSSTYRYAKTGEKFATNTLIKRINNYEEQGISKRLPDE